MIIYDIRPPKKTRKTACPVANVQRSATGVIGPKRKPAVLQNPKSDSHIFHKIFAAILIFSLAGFLSLFPPAKVFAATGDITAVRILGDTCTAGSSCNGWVAEIDITDLSTGGTYDLGLGDNNDPTNAKIVFTVTSPGYDTSGNTTTITRTIYGTKQLRKPYPDQATMDEVSAGGTLTVRVALSDFIYSGDTNITADIGAGFYTQGTANNSATGINVTNNSTLTYPKTIGHFAIEQRRPVNGTQNIEVFAIQRFARNGKPVAKVTVTATGATSGHVETGSATEMTLSTRGDNIPVYSVPLDLSTSAGFTRGELVNINFTAYPWVGNASSVLDSTVDAGATIEKLGLLKWTIMDKMIAVVDPSTGVDATCVASLTQATADANPCLTISGALTKIADQNNTSYSLNRTDGGEVQLKAGTYKTGKYSTQAVTNGYFTIAPHSSTNQAGVVFDGYVTSQYQYAYQRYYNVTFNRAANGYIVFAANPNVLIMEKVNFIDSFTGGWYSGSTNTDVEFLDNTTTNTKFSPGGNDGHSRLNRNNTYTNPTGTSLMVGNTSAVLGLKGSGSSYNIWSQLVDNETNVLIAYTNWLSKTDGYFIVSARPLTNMAIINNLVERIGSSATPTASISGANISNIILWNNTFLGQRVNHENDFTTNYVAANWSGKFNSFNARGDHRMDLRVPEDSSRVGWWSVGYSVAWEGNHNEAISYGGDEDFWGLYSNTPASGTGFSPSTYPVGYVSDKSQGGTNVGNGDYHLTSSSLALNKVLLGEAVLPYDLEGNARHNNGYGAAGAYEWDVTAPSVTVFNIPATASSLTVDITTFTASDAVGVTGYKLTESSTAPAFDASGWSGSAPTTYTFSSQGPKTLYAWAKDAVGNVSASANDTVTITLPTYTIGGTTSGLTGTVVLQNNGGDNESVSTGSFTFDTALADGAAYAVTVLTQPSGQTCTVSNGSGTVASANVTNVSVSCSNDDSTAPVRSAGSPSGSQSAGTTQVTLSLTTDENVTCKYSTSAETAYASMTDTFSTTGGTSHSSTISGLSNGNSYNYYVRCTDGSNANSDDYTISFSIASPASSGGGGGGSPAIWTLPTVPTGGFKMSINGGASTTSNRNVILGFNAETDIKKMAISMTGDFTDASQEDYTPTKQWDLCSKFGGAIKNTTCPDGTYTVYAKFYTAYGRSSPSAIATSTITLKSGAASENMQNMANLPFTTPFNKYLQYSQTDADVKRLQIFLNSDPDTRLTNSGVGSPGKETNYFGPLTLKAVIKFQEKYASDVLSPWGLVKGTGYIGKTTLAKLNELLNKIIGQ